MHDLKQFVQRRGAQLAGVAELSLLKGLATHPRDLLAPYPLAVSIGVTLESFGHYDNKTEEYAFRRLVAIARSVEKFITSNGHTALIIPPDERLGDTPPLYWQSAVSHKAIGRAAGLGWIGKSSLLVTPGFGPRVSLVSVLTDMPLTPDKPFPNHCGECCQCIDACPIGALREVSFSDNPQDIEKVLNIEKCGRWIDETWERGSLCFDCMTQCPIGEP